MMLFSTRTRDIRDALNLKKLKKEKELYNSLKKACRENLTGSDEFLYESTKIGGYVYNCIRIAAQVFFNHRGEPTWRTDYRLKTPFAEVKKMTENYVRAGGELTPLEKFFYNHITGSENEYTLKQVVKTFGTEVGGYKDTKNRPKFLRIVDDFDI